MMVVVIVFYFVAPAYVVDNTTHIGDWKGLSTHKNSFGEFMGEAVVLLALIRFRQTRWLRYLFLFTAVVLLLRSGSATSLFCTVVVIAAMGPWRWKRQKAGPRMLIYAAVALMVIPAIYFLSTHPDVLLKALNRDPSLTGRTQIWAMAGPAMMKFPILGHGYDAFWTGMQGEALDIRIGNGWLVPSAHNGFLDLGLNLGLLGLFVFLCIWVMSIRRAIEFIRLEPGPIGLWPISFLCFFTLHNLTESSLFARPLSLSSLLFAVITASLAVNRSRVAAAVPDAEESATAVWKSHCASPIASADQEAYQ